MKYDILELPEIPRDKAKLKAVIGEARYRARKAAIIRTISLSMVAIAVLILALGSCSRAPAAPINQATIYLPLVER